VLGDQKKISARTDAAGFAAEDLLRPPVVRTYDLKKDHVRADAFYRGVIALSITGDVAKDNDNTWTDPAVVDAQVYAGYTYDYYFKRFGRRGLDNANIRIASVVHPIDRDAVATLGTLFPNFYCNAFYLGNGFMFYGEGLPAGWYCDGQRVNYWSGALDIVGHELTHGVTGFSSRLTYEGEPGALNEAFSDMMGTAIEFFFQTPGTGLMQADYLESEDIVTAGPNNPANGIRSMQNPRLFDDPDHYSIRYTGSSDNGGVHTNSGIPNHAFYLAIEGGTHRLGARVTGVGAANREQIERVFYRAFTGFLVPSSNFAAARVATIQAARELYPTNPAVEAAIAQAWTAVGVN
jgi:thermolysin